MMLAKKSILFFVCLMSAWFYAFSQEEQPVILENFTVFENNGKVHLKWTLAAGSTCNGIQIYRSADNLQFEQIGEIFGTCGSFSEPVSYSFTDINPAKNKLNYYKLELGRGFFSEPVFIEIIALESGGFQIRPNPASGMTRIYYSNENKHAHLLHLFNSAGSLIQVFSSNEDYFDFDVSAFARGVYFFSILSSSSNMVNVKGKLVVQH